MSIVSHRHSRRPPNPPFADPLCRYCREEKAIPLPELGEPWKRYPLFCSLADAAIFGVVCALDKEPGDVRDGGKDGPPTEAAPE
jgi:hypothetical protein